MGHELRANIARRASMRKPLSSLGALELGHCTNNFDAMYESAQRMCASLGAGPSQSEAMDVLESKRLGLLSPSFVRGILVATLQRVFGNCGATNPIRLNSIGGK